MGTLVIRITPTGTNPLVTGNSGLVVPNRAYETVENLEQYFRSLCGGLGAVNAATQAPDAQSIRCDVNPVAATGTWTTSSGSGVQNCIINGVTIANTWATSDTVAAAAMAAAINASTNALVLGMVTATSALGVVTITALPGLMGNSITTTASGTGASAGQARLTLGTDGTAQTTATAATQTFTSSSGSGVQTIVINGVTFTSTWATSDTVAAAAFATLILASQSPLIRGVVVASSALGVVTITAARKGTAANSITTTASGTGMTAGAATMAGGIEALSTRFTY